MIYKAAVKFHTSFRVLIVVNLSNLLMSHYCKNELLEANISSGKMRLSSILNPAVEKKIVLRKRCTLVFVSYLKMAGKCWLHHFSIMDKLFSPISVFYFIIATNICVVMLSELDKTEAKLVGKYKVVFGWIFLLLP